MRPELVKVCGITRAQDARFCIEEGADALGFIFYSPSPRHLSVEQGKNLLREVDFNECLKVAVSVTPDLAMVRDLIAAGFEKFQFHFPADYPTEHIRGWSDSVGLDNLWLAPRLQPDEECPKDSLQFSKVVLLDAYSKDVYGGSGKVGNWQKFNQLKAEYSDHQWYLAGGLSPDNLEEAIASTQPDGIDLNSGVESAPGIKDASMVACAFDKFRK